jgi:signal transduction histidine kinase
VFALFIAVPALALALLGLTAIRADDVKRQLRTREQQGQLVQLADAALARAFDRTVTAARTDRGRDTLRSPSADLLFEIDDRGVVWFPIDRVYAGEIQSDDPAYFPVVTDEPTLALVDRAAAANLRGRKMEAVSLYEQLRELPELRDWVDWQLVQIRSPEAAADGLARYANSPAFPGDARAPNGIPLALIVASFNEAMTEPARTRVAPVLERTLRELRSGRWWLTLDQRRAYDAELRRWLFEARSNHSVGHDAKLESLGATATIVRSRFADMRRQPPRAQMETTATGRTLLIWDRAGNPGSSRWSGVVIAPPRSDAVLAAAVEPVLKNQPFHPVLQDPRAVLWGTAPANTAEGRRSIPLESIGGWSLAFDAAPPPSPDRFLNYFRVLFPIVVLACGLAMTAWIRRRDVALRELQATFVAAITHEFKSPVTSIRLLTERIAGGRFTDADAPRTYCAAIDAEAVRLETLVNRLLEAQQLQRRERRYTFRRASIESIVRDALERMRPQAEAKPISVQLSVTRGLPPMVIDPEAVFDAIRNLVDNAIKYSPAHSTVDVSVEANGATVDITVADEGIGVDPADRDRIFKPFFRSRRGDHASVRGTGLGLALVKATALAHGGSITTSGRADVGSRFTLRLPMQTQVSDSGTAPSAAERPTISVGRRI